LDVARALPKTFIINPFGFSQVAFSNSLLRVAAYWLGHPLTYMLEDGGLHDQLKINEWRTEHFSHLVASSLDCNEAPSHPDGAPPLSLQRRGEGGQYNHPRLS
jgi:hypothetical protein